MITYFFIFISLGINFVNVLGFEMSSYLLKFTLPALQILSKFTI